MTAPNPVRFVAVMLSVGALAAVSAVDLAAKTPRPERQTSRPSGARLSLGGRGQRIAANGRSRPARAAGSR